MKTTLPIEVHVSPAPGIVPDSPAPALVPELPFVHDEPAGITTPPAARRNPVARLLAVLRGDKYMVDAYPPAVPPTKQQ